MAYRAILWDLDGTLLDTLSDITDSVNVSLTAFGYPEQTRETVRKSVGNGSDYLMRKVTPAALPEEELSACLEFYRTYYGLHSREKTAPYEGILPLLDALSVLGIPMAVISNKPESVTKELCELFFGHHFVFAVGENEAAGIRRKPAPDMLLSALERLGISPAEAVYVGDSEVDLATARNAGLPCISVLWGFRDRNELEFAGAQRFAETPSQLLELLLAP